MGGQPGRPPHTSPPYPWSIAAALPQTTSHLACSRRAGESLAGNECRGDLGFHRVCRSFSSPLLVHAQGGGGDWTWEFRLFWSKLGRRYVVIGSPRRLDQQKMCQIGFGRFITFPHRPPVTRYTLPFQAHTHTHAVLRVDEAVLIITPQRGSWKSWPP